jgi:20S proteasome alpha/beta subunit
MAIVYDGGVILAADTRTSSVINSNNIINRDHMLHVDLLIKYGQFIKIFML